jgi:type II secretion system protein H
MPPALPYVGSAAQVSKPADLSRLGSGERDCRSEAKAGPAGPNERERESQSPISKSAERWDCRAASGFRNPRYSRLRSLRYKEIPAAAPAIRAFTLVELMIVIAIIGIMTAMIIPELRGTYEDALLRSTSRQLINACSIAQSRAISVSQPHRVRLEPDTGKYLIEKRVRGQGTAGFIPAADIVGGEGELDRRITVEFRLPEAGGFDAATGPPGEESQSVEPVITFFPDGTADAREVLLQDRQGFRLLLRINPTTARVRVIETTGAAQ